MLFNNNEILGELVSYAIYADKILTYIFIPKF